MTALPEGHALRIFADLAALMEGAAAETARRFAACRRGGRVALPGGRTPAGLYERLAARQGSGAEDVRHIRFTLTDERAVPPEHEDSNYRMLRRAFLEPLSVPADNVLRLRGEIPPARAAEQAHRELTEWAERVPMFDLVILGLGADGHVASLFPAPEWPDFGARLAAETRDPRGNPRITLTPLPLRSTRCTLFLVSGADKAPAVRDTLAADAAGPRHPARFVSGGAVPAVWFLDRAAAALLPDSWRDHGDPAAP